MKFYLLPIGEKFTYQGVQYTKSGPLTASSDENGQNKMIPRSANIQTDADVSSADSDVVESKMLSTSDVTNLVNAFYINAGECLETLKSETSEAKYMEACSRLDTAYQSALKKIV